MLIQRTPRGSRHMYPGLSTNPRSEIQRWLSEPLTGGAERFSRSTQPPTYITAVGFKKRGGDQKNAKKTKLFFKNLFQNCLLGVWVVRELQNPRLYLHAASGKIGKNSEGPGTADRKVRAEIYGFAKTLCFYTFFEAHRPSRRSPGGPQTMQLLSS